MKRRTQSFEGLRARATEEEALPLGGSLVSVIIPAYNAAATIAETLLSVCNQTYRDLEILVIDDGSTDRTPDIVAGFAETDPRIRLIRQGNGGVAAARNKGIAEARGEFIAPIDADDLWRPKKISKQMDAMAVCGARTALIYTWYALIDASGRIVSRAHEPTEQGDVLTRMCEGNLVGNGSAALMRRAAILEAGGYDETLRARGAQGCEDLKLYMRIAERHHFAVIKEHLTGYRRLERNMSSDVLQMNRSNSIVIDEFLQRYPEHEGHLLLGRARFLGWVLGRATWARNFPAMFILSRELFAIDSAFAVRHLAGAPLMLTRSFVAPRLKLEIKRLLGFDVPAPPYIKPVNGALADNGPLPR